MMQVDSETDDRWSNRCRYCPGETTVRYESYFLRANHPERPLAFWLRYTISNPDDTLGHAVGSVWSVFFNGETDAHVCAREDFPLGTCRFAPDAFQVEIGRSVLDEGRLAGSAATTDATIGWNLRYHGQQPPLLLLPRSWYEPWIPTAKSLAGCPLARFNGCITVNGEHLDIVDWQGSQNHYWGTRYADAYAWGQVAGFEAHPGSFLEVASVRMKIGPWWSPCLTSLVLRHNGREEVINGPVSMLMAKSSYTCFIWSFSSENSRVAVEGTISAPREAFVGLNYGHPVGDFRQCLNTKIGSCELRIKDKAAGRDGKQEVLFTRNRAALEILTNDREHGVPIRS